MRYVDTAKLQAALIRFWWAAVFPLIGTLVNWLANGENLGTIGLKSTAIIAVVSGALYGLKKYLWPNTKF